MVQISATRELFLLAATILPINAQATDEYEPLYRAGPYNLSHNEPNITASLYEQAAANPNATRSVKFHPFAWFSNSNPRRYRDIEWTWRVNVSDFFAPNASPRFNDDKDLVDPHVILNTYDFGWTGGGNLSEQVGDENPVCISTLISFTWPANVTNRYTEGDTDNTDCGPVLGDECRDAIISAGANVVNSRTSSCGGPRESWSRLPECAGSLGYAQDQSEYAALVTFNFNAGNGTEPQSSTNDTLVPGGSPNPTSGTGFYAFNSWPRNATNMTAYDEATNRVHVVMINAQLPITNGRMGKPTLLCMRVNTTTIEDESSAIRAVGPHASTAGLVGLMIFLAWFL